MIERANGEAIRVIRERSGFSLRTLAAKAGLTGASLSRIETGHSPGSPESIRKIADALACPRAAIVDHAPAPEPAQAPA
jgi:transcriptional regulator with XRE-family HTH domain